MQGHILAATDGTRAADSPLRIARLLEQRLETRVDVVSVWQPIPAVGIGTGGVDVPVYHEWDRVGASNQQEQVQRQLADLGLAEEGWPVALEIGAAAPTIARLASDRKAALIVLGLGHHDLIDRWFGSETALQVMRLASVPVLAVPPRYEGLPRTAVAAVDFSDFSRDAVMVLVDVLQPGGDVHLLHVLWNPAAEAPWTGTRDWMDERRERAMAELETLARTLEGNAGIKVHGHVREGGPAHEALRLAEEVGADLIAAGSHGAGFLGRILMGSVSTRIVRGARCAVLVSPPRNEPTEITGITDRTGP